MDTTNLSSTLPMNNLSSDERSLKQKMLKAQKGLEKLKEHHPIVGYEDIERKLNEVKMLWKQSLELIDKKKSVILEMERKINDAELGIQNGNDFLERALAERYKRQQRFWIIVAVIVVLGIVGLVLKIIF